MYRLRCYWEPNLCGTGACGGWDVKKLYVCTSLLVLSLAGRRELPDLRSREQVWFHSSSRWCGDGVRPLAGPETPTARGGNEERQIIFAAAAAYVTDKLTVVVRTTLVLLLRVPEMVIV